MKEKNILILATVGGFLDKFEKEDVRILQKMGYQVHYAANMEEPHYLFDEKELRNMGILLHHINIAKSPYMLQHNREAFLQLLKIVETYHIQAVHCHTPVGGLLGRLVGRHFSKQNLCVIYTAHGFHFYKGAPLMNNTFYYAVEKWMAHYTDLLVVINQEDYNNALKLHLKPNGKVYQIPGVGLDMRRFYPMTSEMRKKKRRALGISDETFFIVSVGELNQNKNQEEVLEALVKLRQKNELEGIHYGICGDGFLREQLHTRIRELELTEEVTMYGYRRDVENILGCADAAVFPSRREGLGMAGLEALAMGIPLLAADNRGSREYMQDGRNGYVYPYNQPEVLAESIQKLQKMELEERQKMSRYCRQSAEPFAQYHTCPIMEEVYSEMDMRVKTSNSNRKERQEA